MMPFQKGSFVENNIQHVYPLSASFKICLKVVLKTYHSRCWDFFLNVSFSSISDLCIESPPLKSSSQVI